MFSSAAPPSSSMCTTSDSTSRSCPTTPPSTSSSSYYPPQSSLTSPFSHSLPSHSICFFNCILMIDKRIDLALFSTSFQGLLFIPLI
ncbi:hypothetical protein V6N13_060509 [Hibiscus sabdariffa]|uniref:Uncharacterized protein n=1 Tax=Hibiscus sabdariffa TaxID=183260 RepID=A0ABR2AI71_9ROSI